MIIAVNLRIGRADENSDLGSSSYNLEVLNGVCGFAATRSDIKLWVADSIFSDLDPPDTVDGIIGSKERYKIRGRTDSTPVVNVNSLFVESIPQVCCDDHSIIRMACDHLVDCNLRNLAFLHVEGFENSEKRHSIFIDHCQHLGLYAHVLPCPQSPNAVCAHTNLRESLRALPKPAGLILLADEYGPDVLRLCSDLGINVPSEIAIIGINNNPDLCLSCSPILSSIEIDARRIGYQAARTVVDMIEGRPVPKSQRIPPSETVTRQSSSIQARFSPSVSKVVDFMHANIDTPIAMEDLVYEQVLGRRALEKAFHTEVGESPMHYLRRLRLERVEFLLRTTELQVSEISRECGFRNTNYLCRVFRQVYGTTPHAFRKKKLG